MKEHDLVAVESQRCNRLDNVGGRRIKVRQYRDNAAPMDGFQELEERLAEVGPLAGLGAVDRVKNSLKLALAGDWA